MYKQPRALYVHLSINLRRKKQLAKPFIQASNNVMFYVDVLCICQMEKYFNVPNYYRDKAERFVAQSYIFYFIFKAQSQRFSPSNVFDSNCCEVLTWMSNPLPLTHTNKQTHERHKQINKGHEGASSQMVFSLCVSVGRSPNEREPEQGI